MCVIQPGVITHTHTQSFLQILAIWSHYKVMRNSIVMVTQAIWTLFFSKHKNTHRHTRIHKAFWQGICNLVSLQSNEKFHCYDNTRHF